MNRKALGLCPWEELGSSLNLEVVLSGWPDHFLSTHQNLLTKSAFATIFSHFFSPRVSSTLLLLLPYPPFLLSLILPPLPQTPEVNVGSMSASLRPWEENCALSSAPALPIKMCCRPLLYGSGHHPVWGQKYAFCVFLPRIHRQVGEHAR